MLSHYLEHSIARSVSKTIGFFKLKMSHQMLLQVEGKGKGGKGHCLNYDGPRKYGAIKSDLEHRPSTCRAFRHEYPTNRYHVLN